MEGRRSMLNKKGYTVPMALALMLLLMAFAGSLLLVASYRYQSTFVRQKQDQLYLYATALVEDATKTIEDGKLNQQIAQMVKNIIVTDPGKLSQYSKSYKFQFDLGENAGGDKKYITNSFIQNELGKVYIDMSVDYEPQGAGQALPDDAKNYIRIGDRLKVEYRIKLTDMEYRITADYYCSANTNKNPDGSDVDPLPLESFINMKWQLNKYSGKIYTA